MYSQYEPIILRSLAVIALAGAFLFVAILTFNSGILGGNGSGSSESVEVLDSASAAVPAESQVEAITTPTTGTRSHVVADGEKYFVGYRDGREGVVVLEVEVDESGRAAAVTVAESAGPEFDDAAVAAVKASIFEPARIGDIPVRVRIRIPVTFRLVY